MIKKKTDRCQLYNNLFYFDVNNTDLMKLQSSNTFGNINVGRLLLYIDCTQFFRCVKIFRIKKKKKN